MADNLDTQPNHVTDKQPVRTEAAEVPAKLLEKSSEWTHPLKGTGYIISRVHPRIFVFLQGVEGSIL